MIDIVKALENTKLNMQSEKNSYKDVNKSNKEKFSKILSNKNNCEDDNKAVKSNSDDKSEVSVKDEKVDNVSDENINETESKKEINNEDKKVTETDSKKEVSNEDKKVTETESNKGVSNEEEKNEVVSVDELLELQTLIAELIKQLKSNETTETEMSPELKNQLQILNDIQNKMSDFLAQSDKEMLKNDISELLKKMDMIFTGEKFSLVTESNQTNIQPNIEANNQANNQKLEAIISEINAKLNGEAEETVSKVMEKSDIDFKLTPDEEDKDLDVLKSLAGNEKKPIIQNNFYHKLASIKNAEPVNQPIRANYLEQDIVKNVKFMTVNDMKELTLKIVPKELGEISIKLIMDSGVMKAKISAVNKDTYNLIQNNSANIMEKLNENNIKIQNVEVSIYQEDTLFHKDGEQEHAFNQQFNNSKKKFDFEVEDEIETTQDIDEEYNIHALA
ncbi:flagellar hook-length control protein FliK [Oceanirhabdus seepicola]|uniref:Flagellar hook-length control protein FliK n=1 Tax=Oceanirhabdus seepicola TaxID=2828781 RepID=A0A9J6P7L7_9CLOT|nr:flagellar hook-length control protein FliK [Oceanirhabdus seepicola]